jgi:kynureninase
MLKVEPDQGYIISTERVCSLIDEHADELALILLPGIQYYSGQLLDIPTITAHAHSRGVIIGWDLAHAAGNVELKLHDWDVDFACWCTYKYMNAGAGSIAGAFVHEKHGDSAKNKALKGWYGHDKSSRFLMDNSKFRVFLKSTSSSPLTHTQNSNPHREHKASSCQTHRS